MTPHQASIFVPITVLCIGFACFYLNIGIAKARVMEWKPWSTYWFVRSNGLGGIKNRARLVWMKELGYDETEALTIARYQSFATSSAFFGNFLFILAVSHFVKP